MAESNKIMGDKDWHLDKKVPIALIFAILCQSGSFLWWASSINERVKVLETANMAATVSAPVQSDRLTRVESKMESVQRDLTEIKTDVKSLIRRDALKE
jgi:hypothetical protein